MRKENKYKRQKIPQNVRLTVWRKYVGSSFIGKCYCCSIYLDFANYQVGHDKPISKNGYNNILNLRPICSSCNTAMGNRYTIEQYKKMYYQGIDSPNPPKITATSMITNIDLVPSSLNPVEFEVLITLLANRAALTVDEIVKKVHLGYILEFLDQVEPIITNWVHHGREDDQERLKQRKKSAIERIFKRDEQSSYLHEDWSDAEKRFSRYPPILRELIEIEHSEHSAFGDVTKFLFVGADAEKRRSSTITEINKSTTLAIPPTFQVKEALKSLKGRYYIDLDDTAEWFISPLFYQLWLTRRSVLADEYEKRKMTQL